MNVHYTGRQVELTEAQQKKLEPRFRKIQKILGSRHEPEAHVILSLERRRYRAEVTLNYHHHALVVECAGPDLFSTAQEAVEKLEKRIIRNKDKWRERKRRAKPVPGEAREGVEAAPPARQAILRTTTPAAKPLTVEEAVLELEQNGREAVAYRDAEKGSLAVLFRRRDGRLELVES